MGDSDPPQVDLRDYFDARVNDLKELIQAMFAQRDLSLTVAKTEIDRRLTEMNELRAQISQERGDLASREYVDQRLGALENRVIRMETGERRPELDQRT